MINENPFKINNLAELEMIEFHPTKTCEKLSFLLL